jgi:hypothetical protein
MFELLEDRGHESEDFASTVQVCAIPDASVGTDYAPCANEADIAEPAAFADFWVDNFLLSLPIALAVMLGIVALLVASGP